MTTHLRSANSTSQRGLPPNEWWRDTPNTVILNAFNQYTHTYTQHCICDIPQTDPPHKVQLLQEEPPRRLPGPPRGA